jgi:gluconokinase
MLSDVLERELYVSRFDQASSLGTVALALFACGKLRKLSDFKVDSYTKVLPQGDRNYKNKYERYLYWYNQTR